MLHMNRSSEVQMYTGSMINDLIDRVDAKMKRTGDPLIDLGEAKRVLADRQPMTAFDEVKWWQADRLQQEVLKEESCEEK
jgi:hypothetical protein